MTQTEQTRRAHDLFIMAANKLAEGGAHPIAIAEGGLAAMLHLNGQIMGSAGLVAWLREAADTIENRADRVTVQ
jgi:hypothetical protein